MATVATIDLPRLVRDLEQAHCPRIFALNRLRPSRTGRAVHRIRRASLRGDAEVDVPRDSLPTLRAELTYVLRTARTLVESGIPTARAHRVALSLALSGHAPRDYAHAISGFPRDPFAYVTRADTKPRGRSLYRRVRQPRANRSAPLTDKLRFSEHAGTHGIPVPTTLGPVRSEEDLAALPAGTYILKPRDGKGGREITTLTLPSDGPDSAQVAARLTGDSDFVLQERVENHPAVASLGVRATLTVRTLTAQDVSGSVVVLRAALRIPSDPDALVDNLHQRGMAAAVDLSTGRLRPAYRLYGTEPFATHPRTGAPIAGLQLPGWDEVRTTALRAHAAFSSHVFIGWDIAITPDGPRVLEGNAQPGLDALQRSEGIPLGRSDFALIAAGWLGAGAGNGPRR